jgi:hypothetical protein
MSPARARLRALSRATIHALHHWWIDACVTDPAARAGLHTMLDDAPLSLVRQVHDEVRALAKARR